MALVATVVVLVAIVVVLVLLLVLVLAEPPDTVQSDSKDGTTPLIAVPGQPVFPAA